MVRGFTAIGSIAGGLLALIAFVAVPGPSQNAAEFALFLGRFHPLLVHLPIGALVLVVLLESATLVPALRGKLDGALALALPVASLFGGAAFLLGLLLAHGGGYAPGPVAWHRGLTLGSLGLLAFAGAAFSFTLETPAPAPGGREPSKSGAVPRIVYRGLLFATMGLLTVGAHFGGNLSRGEGYLTEYAPNFVRDMLGEKPREKKVAPAVEPGADRLVYRDVVAPILERTCSECHGERSAKAKLSVATIDDLMKGGESGPALVPRSSGSSSLYGRMTLPASDDEHMPPQDHPQPTAAEIELVRWWIDRGASETLSVADALPPSDSRALLESASGADASASPTSKPAPSTTPSATPTSDASAAPEASSSTPGTSTNATPPPLPPADGLVYRDAVAPILAARCESCHGAAKQKGKLRVDSLAAMTTGGANGPAIVANDASASSLVSRMRLPMSVDEHMPPPKSAQPGENEIELVAWWIDHGANETTKTSALPAKFLGTKPTPVPSTNPPWTPPSTNPSTAPSTNPSITPSTNPSTTPSVTPSGTGSGNPTLPPELPRTLHWEADVVVPLFAARCAPCHAGESPVSTLGLDTAVALRSAVEKGGYGGPSAIPNDPAHSLLMTRMLAPMSDGDHMPPEGSDQVTPDQINLVKKWIAAGATDSEFASASLSPGEQTAVAMFLPPRAIPVDPTSSSASSGASTGSGDATSTTGGGEVPPIHGGGCASCAFETNTEDTALAVASSLALVLVLAGRRRRSR